MTILIFDLSSSQPWSIDLVLFILCALPEAYLFLQCVLPLICGIVLWGISLVTDIKRRRKWQRNGRIWKKTGTDRTETLIWKNLQNQPYTKGAVINFQQNPYTSPPLLMWGGKVFWQAAIALCGILCAVFFAVCSIGPGYWWETAYQVWRTVSHSVPFFFFQRSSLQFWLQIVCGKEQRNRYLFSTIVALSIIGGGIFYIGFLLLMGYVMVVICIANPTM